MIGKKAGCFLLAILMATLGLTSKGSPSELPRPDFHHRFFLTFLLPVENSPAFFQEARLITGHFSNNFYHRIGVSEFIPLETTWNHPEDQAALDLQPVFDDIRSHLSLCRNLGLGLHTGFVFGFVRNVGLYNQAKKADIRNCQWYSDGKLASEDQLSNMASALDDYIWLTLSRYALDLRSRLKQVCYALGPFLSDMERDYPDTFIAASGDGETELNYHRNEGTPGFPVTDTSPFAVLEFRDWILHQGLYDDETGLYRGEGYAYGGAHYRGAEGLNQFNLEFDTQFQTWELQYYHFRLEDAAVTRIPWEAVPDKGNLLPPENSPHHIEGGFDVPREYDTGWAFWRLWERFRQEMVRNHTRDIARWIFEGGFQSGRWYSHQIPADYLWGRSPDSSGFESRLVSSASPLWTADTSPYGKTGITCFDIKYPDGYRRTSEYLLPDLKSSGRDWAVLEFDPFTIPPQFNLSQEGDIDLMVDKFQQAHDAGAHLMAIFKWEDASGEHRTKDTPKLEALKRMWGGFPNRPWRGGDVNQYYPPSVKNLNVIESAGQLKLSWDPEIWYGLDCLWHQLPYFNCFEVVEIGPDGETLSLGQTGETFLFTGIPAQGSGYFVKAVFHNNRQSKNREIIRYHPDKQGLLYFPESLKTLSVDPRTSRITGYIRIEAGSLDRWALENHVAGLVLGKKQGVGPDLIPFEISVQERIPGSSGAAKIDLLDGDRVCVDSLFFRFEGDGDFDPLSERQELIE